MAQAGPSRVLRPLSSFLNQSAARNTYAPLQRRVLEVSGPDAQKFLKGLCCKDVDELGGGYSGFLNASVSSKCLLRVSTHLFRGPSPAYYLHHPCAGAIEPDILDYSQFIP